MHGGVLRAETVCALFDAAILLSRRTFASLGANATRASLFELPLFVFD